MKKLSFWLGILCIVYTALYLLGFLPVSVWQYILDLFTDREPNIFYKIVPSKGSGYQAAAAFLVGLALILFSKLPPKK
ncbi:hypothetical protein [uncultured Microbulbifer sp.]|uniref:hypothetical protein n=1 Tax=uncultured Microbulbifer sp. TaxID=348147 RepID=UPI0026237854|nr:hypothetical protein [uncultured Microbulbifer sp.]